MTISEFRQLNGLTITEFHKIIFENRFGLSQCDFLVKENNEFVLCTKAYALRVNKNNFCDLRESEYAQRLSWEYDSQNPDSPHWYALTWE